VQQARTKISCRHSHVVGVTWLKSINIGVPNPRSIAGSWQDACHTRETDRKLDRYRSYATLLGPRSYRKVRQALRLADACIHAHGHKCGPDDRAYSVNGFVDQPVVPRGAAGLQGTLAVGPLRLRQRQIYVFVMASRAAVSPHAALHRSIPNEFIPTCMLERVDSSRLHADCRWTVAATCAAHTQCRPTAHASSSGFRLQAHVRQCIDAGPQTMLYNHSI